MIDFRDYHGPADGEAKLILLEWRDFGLECVARIKGVVADVLPCGTVQRVGAGLANHVNDATRRAAEFRLIIV